MRAELIQAIIINLVTELVVESLRLFKQSVKATKNKKSHPKNKRWAVKRANWKKRFMLREVHLGKEIVFNKYSHQTKRQVMVLSALSVLGLFPYLGSVYANKVGLNFITYLVIVVVGYITTSKAGVELFTEELFGVAPNDKERKTAVLSIRVTTFVLFILTYLRFLGIVNIVGYGLWAIVILCYCVLRLKWLDKQTIFTFQTGEIYNDAGLIKPYEDIFINLYRGNKRVQVDVTENNLYTCTNDDILIVSIGSGFDSGFDRVERNIPKENIKSIQLKDVEIVYIDSEGKWQLKDETMIYDKANCKWKRLKEGDLSQQR